MDSMIGKWTFNNNEDGIWGNDHFDTKEEAIHAGLEYAKESDWNNLYIGQCQEIPIMSPMDADSVIDEAAEMIDGNYGGDYEPGDAFLRDIQGGDSDRLQELLDEAFNKWVEERNIRCPAFVIEHVEQVPLGGAE